MKEQFIHKDPIYFYTFEGIETGYTQNVKLVAFDNYDIGMHVHDFYELNFVLSGKGIHYFGDKCFDVTAGDVFVVPVQFGHGYKNRGGLCVTHLVLSENFFSQYNILLRNNREYLELFQLEPQLKKLYGLDSFLKLSQNQLDTVQKWLNDISVQQSIHSFESTRIIEGLTVSVLFYLFRIYRENSTALPPNAEKFSLVSAALDCIYECCGDRLPIETLARLAGYSRSNFFRFFKKIMHCSPGEFIVKYKIERAKQLLETDDRSVTQIGLDCGFFDSAHFIRTFKKITGVTPGKYRKSNS